MTSLDILSLSVGQHFLSISVPGDGGDWNAAYFAVQRYHCVQQGCDFRSYVTTFDGGGNWRNGTILSNVSVMIFSKLKKNSMQDQHALAQPQQLDSIKQLFRMYTYKKVRQVTAI